MDNSTILVGDKLFELLSTIRHEISECSNFTSIVVYNIQYTPEEKIRIINKFKSSIYDLGVEFENRNLIITKSLKKN